MPFGISSPPEVFSVAMTLLLRGCANTEVSMDDIFVHAENMEALEKYTAVVIKTINDAGMKLNREKYEFIQTSLKFLGHIFTHTRLGSGSR